MASTTRPVDSKRQSCAFTAAIKCVLITVNGHAFMGPTRISPRSLFLLRFYLQIYCLLLSVLCCAFIACIRPVWNLLRFWANIYILPPSDSNSVVINLNQTSVRSTDQSPLGQEFNPPKSSSETIQNNNKSDTTKMILDHLTDPTRKTCVPRSLVLGLLTCWMFWSCVTCMIQRSLKNSVTPQVSHSLRTTYTNNNYSIMWFPKHHVWSSMR